MRLPTVTLQQQPRREIDCADCPGSPRCWDRPVTRDEGFVVRRELCRDAGDVVFAQGDAFNAVYVVTRGCLKLSEAREDGTDRVLGFRVAGELVGLEGLVQGRHAHRAEAIEPTSVCRLQWPPGGPAPRPAVIEKVLAKTVAQSDAVRRPWSALPAVEQVGLFVQDFTARTQRHATAPLPMTRAEIGSYLGLAEETVVRALSRLRKVPA